MSTAITHDVRFGRPSSEPSHPAMQSWTFSKLLVSRFTGPGRVTRAALGGGHLWPSVLVFVLRGSVRVQRGDAVSTLGTDDLLIFSRTVEAALEFGEGADAVVMQLRHSAGGFDALAFDLDAGCLWHTGNGATCMFGYLLRGLAVQLATSPPRNPDAVAEHLGGMLALVCDDAIGPSAQRGHEPLSLAKSFIEQNLGNSSVMTPAAVAAHLFVSERTLHRLFQDEELTFGGWVRERRLERCREDLDNPALDGEAVSVIGARWGLWDPAHFSRTFKARFGVSPRAYRSLRGDGRIRRLTHVAASAPRSA